VLLLRHPIREYQHDGLHWLAALHDRRFNGILADEMGLGKTIMTIALLAHLAVEREIWGPHLVIVPTSVQLNWEMEFKKWAPGLKARRQAVATSTYPGPQEAASLLCSCWRFKALRFVSSVVRCVAVTVLLLIIIVVIIIIVIVVSSVASLQTERSWRATGRAPSGASGARAGAARTPSTCASCPTRWPWPTTGPSAGSGGTT